MTVEYQTQFWWRRYSFNRENGKRIQDSKQTRHNKLLGLNRTQPHLRSFFFLFFVWACGARWFVSVYTCSTRVPAAAWECFAAVDVS